MRKRVGNFFCARGWRAGTAKLVARPLPMVRTSVLAAATAACLDSDALESLLEDIIDDNDDGRFRRKGGYMKGCTPRYGVANATSYLDRFRYRYWESEIWADIEDDRSYELSSVIAKDWRRDYLLPRA